jgi:thymidine kinase
MAKLHFYFSTMNAGKTTVLLQSNYNYQERGMNTLLYTPAIDDRVESGKIASRIGLEAEALAFDDKFNLYKDVKGKAVQRRIHCVLIDESQFLTKKQVTEISNIVDKLNIPVLAFGLRTDFQGEPFPGSLYLLAWADELSEIKTICHCGKRANHVLRLDDEGNVLKDGDQIAIGGNERYISVCRKHHKEEMSRSTQ